MRTIFSKAPLIRELARIVGKAEIIEEKVVPLPPSGGKPAYSALKLAASLLSHSEVLAKGIVFGEGAVFFCDLPNRRSFSPDASFYIGPQPDMEFLPIPPIFAAEVRSENDYGRRAELAITQKISDYFTAGTQVVWDVDLQNQEVVAKYTPQTMDDPQIFRRGEIADAEPAVPGWTISVDSLFAPQRSA